MMIEWYSSLDSGLRRKNRLLRIETSKQYIERAWDGLYGSTHKNTVADSTPTFHCMPGFSDLYFDRVGWDEIRHDTIMRLIFTSQSLCVPPYR